MGSARTWANSQEAFLQNITNLGAILTLQVLKRAVATLKANIRCMKRLWLGPAQFLLFDPNCSDLTGSQVGPIFKYNNQDFVT